MKKALWRFIAVMALVMVLSSCTMAGAPAGMIGIWKTSFGPFEVYIELKDNDNIYMGSAKDDTSIIGSVEKCTCDEITFNVSEGRLNGTWKYELSGDTLTLKTDNTEYTCTRVK